MIAIIDYEAGNLRSVERALRHIGKACLVTKAPGEILGARRVIFPGVGAAGRAMEVIRARGLDSVIAAVAARKTPFLGICLGAQIILSESEENSTRCLGLLEGRALRFPETGLKIPHMGWNDTTRHRDHPLFEGIDGKAQFYFVHSYYPAPHRSDDVVAHTDYGVAFPSVIGHGNVAAVQFHPEKSGRQGLRLLENFCSWNGEA